MASPGRDPARLGETQPTQFLVGSSGSRAPCIDCYLRSSGPELRDYLHPISAHSLKLPKEGVKVSATAHFPSPHRYLLFGHSQLLGTQNCITCPIAKVSSRLCCPRLQCWFLSLPGESLLTAQATSPREPRPPLSHACRLCYLALFSS